jgi:hypothetical protein
MASLYGCYRYTHVPIELVQLLLAEQPIHVPGWRAILITLLQTRTTTWLRHHRAELSDRSDVGADGALYVAVKGLCPKDLSLLNILPQL